MLIKKPQNIQKPFSLFRLSKTPRDISTKNPKANNLYKNLLKTNRRVCSMLEINKKFEKELINFKYHQLKDLQKYSLKKKRLFSSQKLNQNLTPLKCKKQSSSKQKQKNQLKKQTIILSSLLLTQKNFTICGKKFLKQRFVPNQNRLLQISQNQITLSKSIQDSIMLYGSQTPKIGFWNKQNKIVSLFPVNHKKWDKISNINNQPGVLPLLGCLSTKNQQGKNQKYIITDLYDKRTLKYLMDDFGQLDQITVKHFVRKLIFGFWHLHKNKMYHNRVSLDCLIYTQKGDILINMLMSSNKALNEVEKLRNIFNFPPEVLLQKNNTNQQKNDIWGIGIIVLQLLTGSDFHNNSYHPYNKMIERSTFQMSQNPYEKFKKQKLTIKQHSRGRMTDKQWMKDSLKILQKVQKLIQIQNDKQILNESFIFIDLCESMYMRELSMNAKDFIGKCLNLKFQKRPSIDQLMFHPFLKV